MTKLSKIVLAGICGWAASAAWSKTPSDNEETRIHAQLQKKAVIQTESGAIQMTALLLLPQLETALDGYLKSSGTERSMLASYPMSLDHVCIYTEAKGGPLPPSWRAHLTVDGQKQFLGSQLMVPRGTNSIITACTRDKIANAKDVIFSLTNAKNKSLMRLRWSAPWPSMPKATETSESL